MSAYDENEKRTQYSVSSSILKRLFGIIDSEDEYIIWSQHISSYHLTYSLGMFWLNNVTKRR